MLRADRLGFNFDNEALEELGYHHIHKFDCEANLNSTKRELQTIRERLTRQKSVVISVPYHSGPMFIDNLDTLFIKNKPHVYPLTEYHSMISQPTVKKKDPDLPLLEWEDSIPYASWDLLEDWSDFTGL